MTDLFPVPKPTSEATAPHPGATTPELPPSPSQPKRPWFKRHWKLVLIIAIGVLLVSGGGVLAWMYLKPKPAPVATQTNPTPTPSPTPTPAPLTKASPLTGVQVAPALAARPVVSVIVENHPDARPQSGLQDAGVVYEALAEGGITRFQAFFLDSRPASIGPVRSLRPYFVEWGFEFNAPVAHAGGSDDALNLARTSGLKTLNALAIGAPTFYRLKTRYAPHNLYTSSALLDGLLANRGYNQPATFTPSPRKADTPLPAPKHPTIRIRYSSASYDVTYTYDPATNDYVRSLAGKHHVDANTGKPIRVKNVVVEYSPVTVLDSKGHVGIVSVGRGQGIVFRDGEGIPVTWSKTSRTVRTQLIGSDGKDVPLNAGNTWYSIVPTGKPVSY